MVDEAFWTDSFRGQVLHFPTIRDRMRKDLSQDLPITLSEVYDLVVRELQVPREATTAFPDEVGRPLMWLATAWLWRKFPGVSPYQARSFGKFIADAAGDVGFGPAISKAEEKADRLIQGWPNNTMAPEETLILLSRTAEIFLDSTLATE